MYYFKYFEDDLTYIEVNGQAFEPSFDSKIRITFDNKSVLSLSRLDIDGEHIPLKKGSDIYKKVFNAILNEQWELFTVEHTPITGISNGAGDIVSPLVALYPQKSKAPKANPYAYINNVSKDYGLPAMTEANLLYQKKNAELQHFYFREENQIYHIIFNLYEDKIEMLERFEKQF